MTWLSRATFVAVWLAMPATLVATDTVAANVASAGGFSESVSPRQAAVAVPVVVTLTLPAGTAAADGRVLFDGSAAEFVGVAPASGGTALYPEPIPGGIAFGAFDLRTQPGGTVLRFILDPNTAASLQVGVVVDSAADASGRRLSVQDRGALAVSTSGGRAAATVTARGAAPVDTPLRAAISVRTAVANGRIDRLDLGAERAEWYASALAGNRCGSAQPGDANGDGCVDIVDLQALATFDAGAGSGKSAGHAASPHSSATYDNTFVVNSTMDETSAIIGQNCISRPAQECTLRAAIADSESNPGKNLIQFALPGPPPVTIQLSSQLPQLPTISSTGGTLTIDGYSQPDSQINTGTVGSNAIPGVELRGNGASAHEWGLYITSGGNTVRGLVIDNTYGGIFMDGGSASHNSIVGNWIGYTRTGGTPAANGYDGIILNTGASHNLIGTPDLADRNVIGNWTKGIESYGPTTNANIIQDNLLCVGPTGFTTATCQTGVDHDFGPKNELLGGTATNERNVIGPTINQGVEYSHGWNPNNRSDKTWEITGNQAIGNWIGFRGDGSYAKGYRSGQKFSHSDNDQGINVYDGTYDNVIEGNTIASVYDGIQVMAPDSGGNIVRGNIIGVSPLGQAAPLSGWGIKLRWGTTLDVVDANRISNAARGGIGLLNVDNVGHPQAVPLRIRISRNIVTGSNGAAIYLAPKQSNPKTGANHLVHAPTITSATKVAIKGKGIPGSTVEVFGASRPPGHAGLPNRYLGTATVHSNGKWRLALPAGATPHRVTALQIKSNQDTSALSANAKVSS